MDYELDRARPAAAHYAHQTIADQTARDEIVEGLLDKERFGLSIDPDYSRALSMTVLTQLQFALFRGRWFLFEAEGDCEFLTSDYPTCHLFLRASLKRGLVYFPLTPRLSVLIDAADDELIPGPGGSIDDLAKIKMRDFERRLVTPEGCHQFNELICKCAEDVIISSTGSEGFRNLAKAHRPWRMEASIERIPLAARLQETFQMRPTKRATT